MPKRKKRKFLIGLIKPTDNGVEEAVMITRSDPAQAFSCFKVIRKNTCGMVPFIKDEKGNNVKQECKEAFREREAKKKTKKQSGPRGGKQTRQT